MCQDAVKHAYWYIEHVPDSLKKTKMCNGVVKDEGSFWGHVPDRLKTQKMCNEAVCKRSCILGDVSDHFKTQKMCEKAVEKDPWSLTYVPDWFLTHQKILRVIKLIAGRQCKFLHNYDSLIKWYEGYKKCRAQKGQIRKELMPVTWHPSRWWDWCVPEDEKNDTDTFSFTT